MSEFLSCAMEIEVAVDDYFLLGMNEPKPIVATLQSVQQKKLVMRNKKLLKGKEDGKIYINDYLPAAIQEKRKRDDDVAQIGIKMYGEEKVTYTRAGLTINGTPYRKLVTPPTPSEQINVESERMDKILRLSIQRGDTIQKEGSSFVGFSAPVRSHQDVRDSLHKDENYKPKIKTHCVRLLG